MNFSEVVEYWKETRLYVGYSPVICYYFTGSYSQETSLDELNKTCWKSFPCRWKMEKSQNLHKYGSKIMLGKML